MIGQITNQRIKNKQGEGTPPGGCHGVHAVTVQKNTPRAREIFFWKGIFFNYMTKAQIRKNLIKKRSKDAAYDPKTDPTLEHDVLTLFWTRNTTEKMKNLGTYLPEFDDEIKRYAGYVADYEMLSPEIKGPDDMVCESAAGTEKTSPLVRIIENLRKDIMMEEDKLLLTAREYYKLFPPEGTGDDKAEKLQSILEKIKG